METSALVFLLLLVTCPSLAEEERDDVVYVYSETVPPSQDITPQPVVHRHKVKLKKPLILEKHKSSQSVVSPKYKPTPALRLVYPQQLQYPHQSNNQVQALQKLPKASQRLPQTSQQYPQAFQKFPQKSQKPLRQHPLPAYEHLQTLQQKHHSFHYRPSLRPLLTASSSSPTTLTVYGKPPGFLGHLSNHPAPPPLYDDTITSPLEADQKASSSHYEGTDTSASDESEDIERFWLAVFCVTMGFMALAFLLGVANSNNITIGRRRRYCNLCTSPQPD